MSTRMKSRTVVFRHPFVLGGFERVAPAGSYLVETEEEEIEGVSVPAWRRLATVIHITSGPDVEYVKIDVEDLDKALARDSGHEEAAPALTARLDSERKKNNARLIRRKKY